MTLLQGYQQKMRQLRRLETQKYDDPQFKVLCLNCGIKMAILATKKSGKHEYKETDRTYSVQSPLKSHPFWIALAF